MTSDSTGDTRDTLKRLYLALKQEKRRREDLEARAAEPIAIVGMACRFPGGANDPAAFWDLLESGRDGVSTVPADRWEARAYLAPEGAADTPGTMVTADGGFLTVPLTRFDHGFFRLSPKEARALDPQQRLLLEVAWESLESAGVVPASLKGSRTGVFIGLSGDDYTLAHRHGGDLAAIDAYSITGSTPSTAAGRIAYVLGLEGPAVPVDTACSSSLVALHLACQSLRTGETDRVLAGGVNLILAPSVHVCFSRLQAIAPDGRCKTFDASANGYSRSEGCGMVVLKRLSDARRDGDRVLAVIEATAVNQDGASNGFTAPNGAAQKRLLREALAKARLAPTDVQYVETHGTGTALGDPIEADALADVLGEGRTAEHPLVLGAVKSNIGHLEAAAGIAGVLKVVLALRHGRIPANLHFRTPNPLIPWDQAPIIVPTAPLPWQAGAAADGRRRAGVSSFGFSGTNAHVILAEPPADVNPAVAERPAGPWMLALSAHSPAALERLRARMAAHLRRLPQDDPATAYDLCATTLRHRTAFAHRLAVTGRTAAELADALEAPASAAPLSAACAGWCAGGPVDAGALFPSGSYALADLPPYPYDPQPCTLGAPDGPVIPQRTGAAAGVVGAEPPPHPLLARCWRSPLLGETLWEAEVDLGRLPLFADHRVFGRPVMPAAAFLSMLVAAARLTVGAGPFALTDVAFPAALPLPEHGSVTLHLVLRPAGDTGGARLELASIGPNGALRHAEATLMAVSAPPASPLAAPPSPDAVPVTPDAVHGQQGERLTLGPAFRCGTAFWRDGERAVARLGTVAPGWETSFHPAALDAALQLLPQLMSVPQGAALVPVGVERVEVPAAADMGAAAWAAARLAGDKGMLDLWSGDGRPVLRLSGVRGLAMDEAALRRAVAGAAPAAPVLRVAWQAVAPAAAAVPAGRWAVVPPAAPGWAEAVAAAMPDVEVLAPDTMPAAEVEGLLWLRGLDAAEGAGADRLADLVSLAQALATMDRSPRLWIVTRGAQAAGSGSDQPADPAAAALWGFGRSLVQEAPRLAGGLLDVAPGAGPETVAAILSEIADAAGRPALERALRAGDMLAPRLQAATLPAAPGTPVVRSGATYLITGGTGALGLRVAEWLTAAGAESLVLTARNHPDDAARKRIDALPAQVRVVAADAADATAMAAVLGDIAATLPPLAGVFHLAGHAAAGLLADLTPQAVVSGLAGKAAGALVLDRLTRTLPLDLFVLFSSAAGVLGAPGQSLYAAANAALDAVAASRRAAGLPGLAVAWGPWSGDGMAAAAGAAAQLADAGLAPLDPAEALATLPALIAGGWPTAAVMRADWTRLPALDLLRDLAPRPPVRDETGLSRLPEAERPAALLRALRATAAAALGAARPEDVPTDRSLFELGLDSLMALRIRNAAEAALGHGLPPTLVFDNPSLDALAAAALAVGRDPAAGAAVPDDAGGAPSDPNALSAGQQGLWFLQQAAPESPAFHTCFSARIRSPLDAEALERAFHAAVARHSPLGSLIDAADGAPRRRAAAPDLLRLDRRDGTGRDVEALRADMEAAYRRPFRLDRELPLRLTVWTLAPDDHLLLVVAHHISIDVWSFELLLEQVKSDYAVLAAGGTPDATPPARTYADFVAWQKTLLAGPKGDDLRRFWAATLAGVERSAPPPLARTGTGVDRLIGRSRHVGLDPRRSAALEHLGQSHGATLYATLLAAWMVVEARLGGRQDLVVGTPTLGRSDSTWTQTVGFFVAVVPVRVSLAGDPAWSTLLGRVRQAVLQAIAHQDLPFREIASLAPEAARDDLYPLFQTLFHLRNVEDMGEAEAFFVPGRAGRLPFGALTLEPFYIEQQEGQYPLTVEWFKTRDGLHCIFKYNTACYDETTVARLAGTYLAALDSLLAAPDLPVSRLDLLTPADRAALASWDGGADEALPEPRCLHHRIAALAALHPDATAVTAAEGSLTYAQLEGQANALAARLAAAGLGPRRLAGVCMDRSAALVVTLLAIAKAGAAYVPLAPDLPDDRLRFQMEDAGLTLVVTQPAHAERLIAVAAAGVPVVQVDPAATPEERAAPPDAAVTPEDALYILYTSGTTGRPKGVVISHRALSSHIDALQAAHPLPPDGAVLLKTPLTFDPSVGEVFLPLALGLRLVVAGAEDHRDPAALAALMAREGVSAIYTVPSHLAVLLEEPAAAAACAALKLVICGGERMPAALIRRFGHVAPQAVLLNAYGPTEATICVTAWTCPTTDLSCGDDDVRIGTPFRNARALVLDDTLRPLPVGAPGALYLGGPCLATGYLNRPELTAAAFVPDPADASRRLYRTGDRARLMREADGTLALQFLGRDDSQVKLRGIRLELGEVEAVALRHAAVAEAVARVITAASGEQVLAVAVVPADPAAPPATEDLAAIAAAHLPPAVVPRHWLCLPRLPLTVHGKADGAALDRLLAAAVDSGTKAAPATVTGTAKVVAEVWRAVLGVEALRPDQHFFDLGGSSLMLAKVRRLLEERGYDGLAILDLFRHPTVTSLAAFLDGMAAPPAAPAAAAPPVTRAAAGDHAVAVIGMALRVPGADGLDDFWRMVEDGRQGIARFTRDELLAAGVPAALADDPAYVPANGVLDGVELFDARFFGYSPREAEALDPQHRLFLETAWHALEHGGYGRRGLAPRVGVYAGSEISNYLLFNLAGRLDPSEMNGGYALALANDKDFLATRASYTMDLRGPAMTVQTACSTSLTAVVQACEALLAGHCDMALAGGVSLQLPQRQGYLYREGMVASPDGWCRPFDAAAGGTVNGNGVGVVLLKPLARALADGDTIHGVLKGWGINNDGAHKLGYTAPSEEAQAAAVAQAWAHAGIEPARLGYVEAHGTGTPLGDPIEVAALMRAWGDRARPAAEARCRLGAVKANIGHLGAAAGVTGLIKTVLAVSRRTVPPVPGFATANPAIPFAASPFAVAAGAAQPWPERDGPALAAVSSFGIGGTNVHVVVEEAPPAALRVEAPAGDDAPHLLPVSAGSRDGLAQVVAALAERLGARDAPALRDAAFTLQCGRAGHAWRTAVAARDPAEAVARLATAADAARRCDAAPQVAALFPGQGAQHPDMLLGLYRTVPSFRDDVDAALAHLGRLDDADEATWRAMLFPSLGASATAEARARAAEFLGQTRHTQPALFVMEHALARLWERLGIVPAAMLGHSVGEYVAATLAGVFSPEDALALVTARGRLMQDLPPGGMLAIALPAAEAADLVGPGLDLAGDNGPAQCVLAGPHEALAEARRRLAERGVTAHELATSHAFHSAMMDPILPAFRAVVAGVARRAPARSVVSCLTGGWLTAEQAVDPDYWVAQLRGTVQFRTGVATLLEAAPDALLEIGPGRALGGQAQRLAGANRPTVLATARREADRATSDREALLAAAAALWTAGADIGWDALHEGSEVRRVPLPGYPFDRQRYWIEPASTAAPMAVTAAARATAPPVEAKAAPENRFYVPRWTPTPLPPLPERMEGPTLVVPDGPVAAHLMAAGGEVVTAAPATDWPELLADLSAADRFPRRIVAVEPSLETATRIAQALEPHRRQVDLLLVTRNGQDVGADEVDPAAALLAGPALVVPREMPWVRCRLVDVDDPATVPLARELAGSEPLSAWRRNRRWTRSFDRLPIAGDGASLLRRGGVALITGGLGGIGLSLARLLVREWEARVTLVGRTAAKDLDAERRAALAELGDAVRYVAGDVTDTAAMAAAVADTRAAFGGLHAVIHCAGVAAQGPVTGKTPEGMAAVLAPKVAGTLALEAAVADLPLDVMVLFSSSSAVLGSSGLMDYAAANAFLDAVAQRRTAEGRPTVAIGWDAWADIGMSRTGRTGGNRRLAEQALTVEEGLDAFRRILTKPGLPHIVVSPSNLPAMLAAIADAAAEAGPSAGAKDGGNDDRPPAAADRHARPDLAVPYIAPAAGAERQIAEVWEDVLGIAGVGAADNFFDLGGDSLIGGKLVLRLNEALGATLSPVILYEAPTVQALARAAAAAGAAAPAGSAERARDLDLDLDLDAGGAGRRGGRRRRQARHDQEPVT